MMNRRHFIRASGWMGAMGLLAGPVMANRLLNAPKQWVVVLSAGIWNQANKPSSGMVKTNIAGQSYRLPVWAKRAKNSKFGWNFGDASQPLFSKINALLESVNDLENPIIQAENASTHWAKNASLPLPSMHLPTDIKRLENLSSTKAHQQLLLLHSTDVAHHQIDAYFEAEKALFDALLPNIEAAQRMEIPLHLFCLHGRDAHPNAMGGVDHASEAAAGQGWWMEF